MESWVYEKDGIIGNEKKTPFVYKRVKQLVSHEIGFLPKESINST